MTREEKLALAGDYVLGLLEGAEASEAEALITADTDFAAMVARFAARMAALDDTVAPAPVPGDLWSRIEAGIDAGETSSQSASVIPLRPAAKQVPSTWDSMRWVALAASLAVAALAGWFVGQGSGTGEPVAVAILIDESTATPGALVEAYGDDSVRLVTLRDFEVPEGRIMQVWTLPDPQTGPVSLGTLAANGTITLQGPDLALPGEGQLYEITLEPAPGSPTGRPTGPILVKGFAALGTN